MSMVRIPTELYIYVPKRSSASAILYTNAWCNLTRKDTGEGIGGKELLVYLDGVNISHGWTARKTGAVEEIDINPTTEGMHTFYVEFLGDAEFEPCKSEEIILKCDPTLAHTRAVMEVTPVSGNASLTITVTGFIEERYLENNIPSGRPPSYPLPLELMVLDRTNIKTLRSVKTVMCNPDGTYTIEYTFVKSGAYYIFVNFLGDEKYESCWSNNGAKTLITVTGGELPMSFEKDITLPVQATMNAKLQWLKSETEPTAPEGFERFSQLDLDFGVLGKYWAFIKKA